MTNLEFTTQMMDIINELLEVGITSCNIHDTRTKLDYLFDDFEEQDGLDEEIPNLSDCFFPDLENDLNALTIFF